MTSKTADIQWSLGFCGVIVRVLFLVRWLFLLFSCSPIHLSDYPGPEGDILAFIVIRVGQVIVNQKIVTEATTVIVVLLVVVFIVASATAFVLEQTAPRSLPVLSLPLPPCCSFLQLRDCRLQLPSCAADARNLLPASN